jgi:hypothetical protein
MANRDAFPTGCQMNSEQDQQEIHEPVRDMGYECEFGSKKHVNPSTLRHIHVVRSR